MTKDDGLIAWDEIDPELHQFYNIVQGSNHYSGIEKMKELFTKVCLKQRQKTIEEIESTRPPSLEDMLGELESLTYKFKLCKQDPSKGTMFTVTILENTGEIKGFIGSNPTEAVSKALEQIKENDNA